MYVDSALCLVDDMVTLSNLMTPYYNAIYMGVNIVAPRFLKKFVYTDSGPATVLERY